MYRRVRKANELRDDLHGKEEILNNIFNLTYAIAPDGLIHRTLVEPLGLPMGGTYTSLGREIGARYGWKGNTTQQDGLFVNDQVAVAVELKLGSKSWDGQVLKNSALLTWEELYSGEKAGIGLLYIVPETALPNHWKVCGLNGPKIDPDFLERVVKHKA